MATDWESLLWQPLYTVKAKTAYHSGHGMDLSFEEGEIIDVLGIENDDWWNGAVINSNKFGSFPKKFVEVVSSQVTPRRQSTVRKSSSNSSREPSNDDRPSQDERPKMLAAQRVKPSQQDRSSYISRTNNTNSKPADLPPRPVTRPKASLPSRSSSTSIPSHLNASKSKLTESLIESVPESITDISDREDPLADCNPVLEEEFGGFLDCSVIDFSIIDDWARDAPADESSSINRLSDYLTSPWDYDIYKLRCIFTWIALNIAYDTASFFAGRQLPNGANDVLRRRTAVCAGYSNLFDALAHKAGLNVWQVTGQAKGAGYEPGDPIKNHPHAWNAVLLDGEYLLIDSTWGSGSVNNQTFTRAFKPFYFLVSPMKLIYSHFPDNPSEQYISPPISLSTFRDMPHIKADFFIAGLQFIKFPPAVIEVHDDWFVVQLEWCAEDDGSWLMGKLEWHGQAVEVLVQRMEGRGERDGRIYNMYCGIPSGGEGKLNYFVLPKSGSGPMAGAFKVINHGTGSSYRPFVQTYSVPFTFSILSPVYQSLTLNRKIRFEILIFTDGHSALPDFCVMDPSSTRRERMERLRSDEKERSYLFAADVKIDSKGQWKLAFADGAQGYFSFVAVYDAE